MSLARAKAKLIIDEYGIDSPEILERLEDICFDRGASVEYKKLVNSEARISMKDGKAIISINPEGAYKSRLRFSIAHELGHFELHQNIQSEFICTKQDFRQWFVQQREKQREVEANEFAAELLMPEILIKPIIEISKPSIQLLEDLASKFQTSLMATSRRFIELTDEACAAVWYDGERIIMAWRSKFFIEQGYWVNPGALDPLSYAHDATQGEKVPDYMSSVEAETWFDVPSHLEEETIKEQTKFFQTLQNGLSLLWIDKGALIRN